MQISHYLVSKIATSLEQLEEQQIQRFHDRIDTPEQSIFITGAGRSLLVGKFFAMRLMHLGKRVHIVGELCTPSIQQGDILIAISASGNTMSVINICQKAKELGAFIILISQNNNNKMAKMADLSIIICVNKSHSSHYAPMGTLFETSTLIFLETFIGEYMLQHGISEKQLQKRHANLE